MSQESTENRQFSPREKAIESAGQAITILGGQAETARKFQITRAAVHQWASRGVPANRVRSLSALVNHQMTPEQIRPDIFGDQE